MAKKKFNHLKHEMNLSQLTLIIPTFNRHKHLSRLLNYYATKKTNLSFLILDSSETETVKLNQVVCAKLADSAQHIVFPSSLPVATKLLDGLKRVTTPFCAFCADDDLIYVTALIHAIDYLSTHPEVVCVDGIYLNFYIVNNKVQIRMEYASKGINAEHPGARIFKLFQKFESLFYGVFKTNNLLKIFSGMINIESLHYQELFQSTAALLLGKSHRLPLFYAARQQCEPAESSREKWQTFQWFAENRLEFLEHYLEYRATLWQFYGTHVPSPKLTQDSFYQMMDLAHAVFFAAACPPSYFHSVLKTYWPNDIYSEPNLLEDNICQQLKKPHVKIWYSYLQPTISRFQKFIFTCIAQISVYTLDREVRQYDISKWKCKLRRDIRWLAGVNRFRKAYHELCLYLDRLES